ncbi:MULTISPECIES: nitrite reductase large subunit NirB [Lonsdalea]|uniref:Nitrite reductase small subunit NirD n=1 Tax=Lonsdalea populi TaxID=1172565 RepID=A0A3N0UC43_9GAMM|nr:MULTISPECIES: nitrite reductase large subunit NirB [Lonsdalea]ROH76572.1 nitrite reductase small subunit NirD [Lonsdalea populi]ROH78147.1 nitrite reductase small subunit NirD [Lonsdalea populi]ROH78656.1 nitrite reductase small subunit NirD [Lonsdalea populi]
MDKPTLIVIGNGMAGVRLVERLCQLAAGHYRIVVVGEEPQTAYNRILLTPVLSGEKSFADIVTHDADWYQRHEVTLLTGVAVTEICRETRTLKAGNLTLSYDHLAIATGSRPFMPPLPGAELASIYGFRSQQDVDGILNGQYAGQPAVVIGGGVLGIEAAAGLALRGMTVTLLHRGPHLMDQQLDAFAAGLLRDSLSARGIHTLLQAKTVSYIGDASGHVQAVMLDDGRAIPAERVVVAAGVRPNISLALAAGLRCDRGIVVSSEMQTSDPHISAIGECCQPGTLTPGLVAPCWQQAETLAARLAGVSSSSPAMSNVPLRLKVTGLNLFCAGELNGGENGQIHSTFDPFEGHYRRLFFRDSQLKGVLLWGDIGDSIHYLSSLDGTQSLTAQLSVFSPPQAPHLSESQSMKTEQLPLKVTRSIALSKPVLVMAGHGMVGHHFLQQLVERELHLQYQIIVFAEETSPAYDRVHLSELFSGRSAQSLSMVEEGFFEATGIELRLGHGVDHVDARHRFVVDRQGHQTAYDLLVLATGSYPFVPPIPGNDAPGCMVYRTLEDLSAIKACAEKGTVGVVVGGGLLGLEAANALKHLGLQTHVVEFAPRLMGVQLDEDGAGMLRRKVEALGVQVHTGKETRGIVAGEMCSYRMEFADGSHLETDLVLFSAGIRPNDRLAKQCGLDVGPRGGIVINDQCRTSDPAIFAIGECALWKGQIFGLVAPGYQMARILADTLSGSEAAFKGADMSTKLKLLGVEVASIGDAHGRTPGSQSYTWVNGPAQVYKKIVVSQDGKRLLGAVLVGDSSEYGTLLQMMLNDIPLPTNPEGLILPASTGEAPQTLGVAALPGGAQICSCHNVSKADICEAVKGGCGDMAAIKSCTRAATGCGGCAALTKQVMEFALTELGVEVKKDVCEHFAYSRQELYHLVRIGNIRSWDALLGKHGQGRGCEICKPLVGSILASCWNDYLLKPQHLPLQDTNDRYFANIQKDGTYSVVPRVPAGEITPDGLIAIGRVAKRYNLYTKITGGQRIDLFGARLEQLPAIWQQLVDAGFETGHAYGKSLRTVKSCVGSSWCRYGVQNSTSLALLLENRYKGLRSPHKIKMAVSGCTRECAEAQSKDVGVIATDKGWNLYVCGNGGMKPRHADLLAQDMGAEELVRTVDRFLMFYIRTADRLQRTSTWMDNLEGGMNYLRQVVLEDSLNIAAELEHEMSMVIDTYQCEWQTTLADPDRLALFKPFVNSEEPDETVVMVQEREQLRPATHEERQTLAVSSPSEANAEDWVEICALSAIPGNAGMAARLADQQIALFHLPEHPQQVFALSNHEPDSDANVLARGLIGDVRGEPVVISPLYKQRFSLLDGRSVDSCGIVLNVWPVKVDDLRVWVRQRPVERDEKRADIIQMVSL